MIKHTIHYQISAIRKAGWIAFADELVTIMREYWHMKRALRKIIEILEKDHSSESHESYTGLGLSLHCDVILLMRELEKKVRL